VPVLGAQYESAVISPGCMDMDVAAQLQGYLRLYKRNGGLRVTMAGVSGMRFQGGRWRLSTPAGDFAAPLVINAAGAWADVVARLAGAKPVGLQALRRTMFTFDASQAAAARNWPLVIDVDEQFYFKPEAGRFLATPADEIPAPAGDAQAQDLDLAVGVDRIEKATRWTIQRLVRSWAGLRTFAPDRVPVIGRDPQVPGFFWLAGQGGYGIMSAPANAMLSRALILGEPLPEALLAAGIDAACYSPQRFLAAAEA